MFVSWCWQCEVSGKIVGALQVSARREQYEQLLETLAWTLSSAQDEPAPPPSCRVADNPAAALPTQVTSN